MEHGSPWRAFYIKTHDVKAESKLCEAPRQTLPYMLTNAVQLESTLGHQVAVEAETDKYLQPTTVKATLLPPMY